MANQNANDNDTNVINADNNSSNVNSNGNDDHDAYEKVCYVCRRPESKAGKMITISPDITICNDCMQKAFNQVNSGNFPKMFGIPEGFPFAGMPDDLMNMMGGMNMGMPEKQKIKKKKPDDQVKPIDLKAIPSPHQIHASLNEYVVGQEHAKKVMSVAVYNHYKRVAALHQKKDVEIEKSNMLMIGPTGSGKTYLVKTLAKLLDVPLAIADATSLTEAADNDVEKAQTGIVFIDEIDKLARKRETNHRDVNGESVQQGLLKLLEGAEVEVPVGASSKNAMVPMVTVDTTNILFICGGAFPDLDQVIRERLAKKSSMGFNAELKDHYDNEKNIFRYVETEDLRNFGMIPEFLGRLPIVFTLDALDEKMLTRILSEPKNALLKQYRELLAMDEVDLIFEPDALEAIAAKALKKDTGARALRAIIEDFMLDIMYEIPKDDNIGRVRITRAYVEHTGGPVIELRGQEPLRLANEN